MNNGEPFVKALCAMLSRVAGCVAVYVLQPGEREAAAFSVSGVDFAICPAMPEPASLAELIGSLVYKRGSAGEPEAASGWHLAGNGKGTVEWTTMPEAVRNGPIIGPITRYADRIVAALAGAAATISATIRVTTSADATPNTEPVLGGEGTLLDGRLIPVSGAHSDGVKGVRVLAIFCDKPTVVRLRIGTLALAERFFGTACPDGYCDVVLRSGEALFFSHNAGARIGHQVFQFAGTNSFRFITSHPTFAT
ncbi:hypothetical protein Rsub_07535 [Raphidocelis subcapitata]|uniref:Uncharacterized protein n=1 Tax=Raphidocelis subcapitata TaxID=307507 RepID=A0A2V0P585_9CHLO|nr:hypothetical protein Rsub_07535 [Raphidocelis subcapitata]|eukprot:GBF95034.1 hypothetical protein Rsub_07535 [Raphidocelis subcapitata]